MAKTNTKPTKTQEKNQPKAEYIWAVGRRKRAIARVRLYTKDTKSKNIDIIVNDKPVGQYFHNPISKMIYGKPLELTKTLDRYRVTVKVEGSGLEGQLDAMLHGISRALVKADESFKAILKPEGLLTRDPRKKEKRAIGQGGRARAKKQSPKR